MLYLPGVGEVPIGISGHQRVGSHLVAYDSSRRQHHAQRWPDCGPATRSGCADRSASWWPLDRCRAPTSCWWPAAWDCRRCDRRSTRSCATRRRFGRVTSMYGARTPDDAASTPREYDAWTRRRHRGANDGRSGRACAWTGNVGVVPLLIDRLQPFDPERTVVLTCGPEVMMRYAVRSCVGPRNVDASRSGARWNATCNAPSACAGIASSARSSFAKTDRYFATIAWRRG